MAERWGEYLDLGQAEIFLLMSIKMAVISELPVATPADLKNNFLAFIYTQVGSSNLDREISVAGKFSHTYGCDGAWGRRRDQGIRQVYRQGLRTLYRQESEGR